ncbi:MAG: histone deacetylase [Deltaproteobacteria bacterium]|nr:histone deacetylase [Deltaproteobacteria bacterium]
MNITGIVRDQRYMNHHMGDYHPESPKRLEAIYAMLEDSEMAGHFKEVPVRRAERNELEMIHAPEYVDEIAATEGKSSSYLDPDTQTSAGSYEAALLAAGGLCEAISMVNAGELDNAFALVRPPGHHAERARAMGFCLFNNVAVGARFAQKKLDIQRILLADWDLHHGNGTQHSFESDPSVLYFSTHQYPYYPGTGAFGESGKNEGEGFTVNVPLGVGCGDGEYVAFFENILKPIAHEYKPELILVSAGFDTYKDDPLGGMRMTPDGYAGMTRSLMDIAGVCCEGKMVMTLEGGYHVQGQAASVKRVLEEMSGLKNITTAAFKGQADKKVLENVVSNVGKVHQRYWKSL